VGVDSAEQRKQLGEQFSLWLQDLERLNAAMKDLSNRASVAYSASAVSSSSSNASSSNASSVSLHLWTEQAFQPPPGESCHVKQVLAGGHVYDMCLRTGKDLISDVIKGHEGRWPDW
jgi:hypothetical protein